MLVTILAFSLAVYAQDALNLTIEEAFEHYSVGGYSEAAPLFVEAYGLLTTMHPKDYVGSYKLSLYSGLSYKADGDNVKASEWLNKAVELGEKLGYNDEAFVKVYSYLADAERQSNEATSAITHYEKALSMNKLKSTDLSVVYYGLADSYRQVGSNALASKMCDNAIGSGNLAGLEKVDLACDIVRADLLVSESNFSEALKVYGHVHDIAMARGYSQIEVNALIGLGSTSETLNFTDAARHSFEQALLVALESENYENIKKISSSLMPLISSSRGAHKNIENDIISYGDTLMLAEDDTSMVLWYLATEYYKADKNYNKMFTISDKIYNYSTYVGSDADMLKGLYGKANSSYYLENYVDADLYIKQAIVVAKKIGDDDVLSILYALQAENYIKLSNFENAAITMQQAITLAVDNNRKEQCSKRLTYINSEIVGIDLKTTNDNVVGVDEIIMID